MSALSTNAISAYKQAYNGVGLSKETLFQLPDKAGKLPHTAYTM